MTDQQDIQNYDQLLQTPQYKKYILDGVELIKSGWRANELFAEYMVKEPSMNRHLFIQMVKKIYDSIKTSLHKDREYVFQLHMNRYEELYRDCISLTDRQGRELDPEKQLNAISTKISNALKSLKAKEDLIGLHDKDLVIEINNKTTTIVNSSAKSYEGYSLAALNVKEKKELLTLLQQCRVGVEGIQPLKIKKVDIEQLKQLDQAALLKADEVEYTELPVRIIDDMIQDQKQEQVEYLEGAIVEDLVDRTIESKELNQLQNNIQNSLKDKFEALMKRKKK